MTTDQYVALGLIVFSFIVGGINGVNIGVHIQRKRDEDYIMSEFKDVEKLTERIKKHDN